MRLRTFQQWMAAVPVMKWEDLLAAHPRPHLVVAWLHATHRTGEGRVASFDLLKKVATALDPGGDWAMTDANPKEIYIAYEEAADAAQLCTLVRAKPLGPSLQWMSQAAFRFQREAKRLSGFRGKQRDRSQMHRRPGPVLRRDIRFSESDFDSGGLTAIRHRQIL